jgi:ferredoxin
MRVLVDRDRCEGNAVCMKACPEVFEVGEDDCVRLLVERPTPDLYAKVEAAVKRCPRQALAIAED